MLFFLHLTLVRFWYVKYLFNFGTQLGSIISFQHSLFRVPGGGHPRFPFLGVCDFFLGEGGEGSDTCPHYGSKNCACDL